jgi:hypothetical protein
VVRVGLAPGLHVGSNAPEHDRENFEPFIARAHPSQRFARVEPRLVPASAQGLGALLSSFVCNVAQVSVSFSEARYQPR